MTKTVKFTSCQEDGGVLHFKDKDGNAYTYIDTPYSSNEYPVPATYGIEYEVKDFYNFTVNQISNIWREHEMGEF